MRKTHFLGTKIRNLRKRNNLTMEDLSARCMRVDSSNSPSVSYLSMIERGKRVPSADMLAVIAAVFQKEVEWFLDDVPEEHAITPEKGSKGGISGMPLEPSFLFSNDILQIAIPEMLSQTGTSGRQFAHLLIRAHQEHHQNHFPDLERAAEDVGLKRMPLMADDMLTIAARMGLVIKWIDRTPQEIRDEMGASSRQLVTSFFEPPSTIYLNNTLKNRPHRLKYDLAVHIGHCVLHNKDGLKSVMTSRVAAVVPESLASAMTNTSAPAPPDITSRDPPPMTVSSPVPPFRVSFPLPPSRLLLPPETNRMSSPSPPNTLSDSVPAFK